MDSDGENLEDYEAIEENQGVDIQNSDAEGNENEVENTEADENEDEKQRKVIKPKRVIRNPQPKLNAETLKGARGLTAVAGLFSKQKFKGIGHEKEDLRILLKTYNYWCHRMFPKYPFDQAIDKIEKLGNKKPVITLIKKIRMGLLVEEEKEIEEEEEDEEGEPKPIQEETNRDSEFDALLPAKPEESKPPQLTKEQEERIRFNKEKALKLRQERLRKIQQQAESKLKPSHILTQTSEVTDSQCIESEKEVHTHDTEHINSSGTSQNDHIEDLQGNAQSFSSMRENDIAHSKDIVDSKRGGNQEKGEEINVSTLERDLNTDDTNIFLSGTSSLQKNLNEDRPESPILGMKFRKENIVSSTMIQDSIVFEGTAEDATVMNVDGFMKNDSTLLREEGSSKLTSEKAEDINVAIGNEITMEDCSKTIEVSNKNRPITNIAMASSSSETNGIDIDTVNSNEITRDKLSLNENSKDLSQISLNLKHKDLEGDSADIIEDTPKLVQDEGVVNENTPMECN